MSHTSQDWMVVIGLLVLGMLFGAALVFGGYFVARWVLSDRQQPLTSPEPAPATPTPTPTPANNLTVLTKGWSQVGYGDLPQPNGYSGWVSVIGDDRVPGSLEQFDLTLYEGQVALFQGVQFDATPVGGPAINQCYVALVMGPVNWVNGELQIGTSYADWHQVSEGFDPFAWLAQKALDVSNAYSGKDPNCSLEKLQILLYQP